MKKITIIMSLTLITFLCINFNSNSKVYAATPTTTSLDVNNDGKIDINDLAIISSNYNVKNSDSNYQSKYDLNSDGIIDLYDMTLVSKAIGTSIPSTINVLSVTLNKTTDTLTIGDTDTLTTAINPTNATNQNVAWTSSNNSIAKVDTTGKITALSAGTATITVTTADGSKTASCVVTVNNEMGYVNNSYLNVRSSPEILSDNVVGQLYYYEKIEILDTEFDASSGITWDKIIYNNAYGYTSDGYIIHYSSPPDNVVNIAKNITNQFEVGDLNQIAGNFDGQGLSLGYFQWCIGQGSLQPLLYRMDKQYNSELKNIFGTNYASLHNMLQDSNLTNQLNWAKGINDSNNKITEPWYSQFVSLTKNEDFINIEKDAEVSTVNRAMNICNTYNLKTVRGYALAFDIATQNGTIIPSAANIISTAINQNPNMTEKDLLGIIANAVADSSVNSADDVRSRKMAIVNGQGTVHTIILYLDRDYGLSDNSWR
jgi:hypothetical protein